MVYIREEFQTLIPPLTENEYNQLEQNILEHGIQDALKVWNDAIVDGHNRFEIAKKHNLVYELEHMDFADDNEAILYIIQTQLGRRNTSPYDRTILVIKMKETIALQLKTQKQEIEIPFDSPESEEPVIPVKSVDTRKEMASLANVSEGTIMMASYIHEQADEETVEKVRAGDIKISAAYKKIKRQEKLDEQTEEIKENLEPVDGKFDILVVDPPWPYGREYDPESSRVANPYPEMEIEEIAAIELPDKDDSILWLWTTHRFLKDAMDIMDAWGYEYKAAMVWDKVNMGMGHWLRMQVEFCLLGIKGKPVWNQTNIRDILRETRREHSRKPEGFYDMIDEKFTGSKIDFFSREAREGWYSYGDETTKFSEDEKIE